jgi:hypothetical protein
MQLIQKKRNLNFKKIKNKIINGIADRVISEGFLFNKKEEIFEKNIPGGIVTFYFLHVDYKDEFIFELWWGVRIDRMADIYNMVTEKKEEYFHATRVLANSLGRLIDYTDNGNEFTRADRKKFSIRREDDVEGVIREALSDIQTYILPYFQKNVSMERIDQILNHNPEKQIVHSFVYPYRAMMGLIAAKLTGNTNYNQLVSIYDIELVEAEDQMKREYEKLKELLSKM